MEICDVFPSRICEYLRNNATDIENMRIFATSDIDLDNNYCNVYLCADEKEFFVISEEYYLEKREGLSTGYRRPKERSKILSFERFPLSPECSFSCTEFLTTGVFEGEFGKEKKVISMYSRAKKREIEEFCRDLECLVSSRELKEHKAHDDDRCPKCHSRYPDERKICPKCADRSGIMKRLFSYLSKYRIYVALTVLSLVAMTALSTFTPYVGGKMFYDDVLTEGGKWYGKVLFVILLMIATKLLNVFANMINGIVTAKIAAKVVYDIKKTTFEAITRLSMSFFSNRQTGGLMTSVNNDASTLYAFLCEHLPYLLISSVQFIAIVVLMFILNPVLTLFTFITVPVFLFTYRFILHTFRKLFAKDFAIRRSFNSIISDVLSGIRVVKAFAKEKDEETRFSATANMLARSNEKISVINSTVFPALYYVLHFGLYIVWGFGAWLVISGDGSFTLGMLMTFIGYTGMAYSPLSFFSDVSRWWAEGMNAASRIFEILDSEPEVYEKENAKSIDVKGDIRFENVDFAYSGQRNALENISFELGSGETLGIVGETGAGKSTLVNLLIRLYDTTGGNIYIDGENVRDLSFSCLRENFAIVSQETYIFRGTIYDNIAYANPKATHDQIIAAAKIADAHRFIIKLPDGYDTLVGWGNKELSGGEKQRISIARAILKDPKILILDEATSAMDTETERRIQNAIDGLSKGKTTIMIAHRLSTLRNADRLLVIDHGHMPEYGTHKELIQKRGIYFELYKLQYEALKTVGIS